MQHLHSHEENKKKIFEILYGGRMKTKKNELYVNSTSVCIIMFSCVCVHYPFRISIPFQWTINDCKYTPTIHTHTHTYSIHSYNGLTSWFYYTYCSGCCITQGLWILFIFSSSAFTKEAKNTYFFLVWNWWNSHRRIFVVFFFLWWYVLNKV